MRKGLKIEIMWAVAYLGLLIGGTSCIHQEGVISEPASEVQESEADPLHEWMMSPKPIDTRAQTRAAREAWEKLNNILSADPSLCQRLQQWGLQVLRQGKDYIDAEEIPEFVQSLQPEYGVPLILAETRPFGETRPHVWLSWVCGEGCQWGIFIGEQGLYSDLKKQEILCEYKALCPGVITYYMKDIWNEYKPQIKQLY